METNDEGSVARGDSEMCVFFCANPLVHEWLDMRLARAHRQTFQLCAICPDEPDWEIPQSGGVATRQAVAKKLDTATERRLMKRSAWIQAYCASADQRRASSQDWHKALDAIANAWGRLLSFVRLRR
jgi:hypothetical protein